MWKICKVASSVMSWFWPHPALCALKTNLQIILPEIWYRIVLTNLPHIGSNENSTFRWMLRQFGSYNSKIFYCTLFILVQLCSSSDQESDGTNNRLKQVAKTFLTTKIQFTTGLPLYGVKQVKHIKWVYIWGTVLELYSHVTFSQSNRLKSVTWCCVKSLIAPFAML